MKIVFITPRLTLGGYEKVVVNYANMLHEKGHAITILCGSQEGELVELISKEIQIVNFNVRFRKFLIPLVKYLRKNEVDILYAPFRSYTSIAIVSKWLSRNKKCVIYGTMHGYEKSNKSVEHFQGKIIKHAEVLSSLTRHLAKHEEKALGISEDRYICLKNPVIDSRKKIVKESHKWLGENKKVPVIITSGRLEKDKRYDLALRIFAETLKYADMKMILLGSGSELKNLKNLANKLEISDKVDFLGFVSNPMGYMIQSDMYLHTAEVEAFGNTVVEALYCNLPIITTNCVGPVEIIEENRYGIVIDNCNTAKQIEKKGAEAILDVLHHKKHFRGMKEKALQYDVQSLEEEFLEPYYEYIRRNKKEDYNINS